MGLDWIGLDISQTVTPPRAPRGANNILDDRLAQAKSGSGGIKV